MENKRVQKLVEYLYPTDEIMEFMCKDLYQELLEVIPKTKCIGYKNTNKGTRKENLNSVQQEIHNYIFNNENYKNVLIELYKKEDFKIIEYDILIGLVLYISNITPKYAKLDIFKDNKSICYNMLSVLNLI